MASINDLATAAMASDTPSNVKRGAFIVLEGLDRSGKTTQVKLLEQRFVEEGKKVRVMRFPGTRPPLSLFCLSLFPSFFSSLAYRSHGSIRRACVMVFCLATRVTGVC